MYRDENRGIFWSKFYMKARVVLVYTVLIFLSFLCLITIYLLFANATKSHLTLITPLKPNDRWIVLRFGTSFGKNFGSIFSTGMGGFEMKYNAKFITALGNSFIVAIGATFCSVYFSTVVAYGIHMYRFKLRNAAFTFILVIMMIPTQVSTTGFVSMCYKFNWIDHLFVLIIPAVASPVTFFYIKQYMESVLPFEMVEAARVDGAGEIRIFHQIVLPVLKPALAVQIIFAFVGSWNNYFVPQLVLGKANKRTLPIIVATLYSASNGSKDYGLIYMVIFLSIVPLTVVYFIFSRYIMKGLTLGAVKG